jgi:hypothetical protein
MIERRHSTRMNEENRMNAPHGPSNCSTSMSETLDWDRLAERVRAGPVAGEV